MAKQPVGIIGVGHLGRAIVHGLLDAGQAEYEVFACDRSPAVLSELEARKTGGGVVRTFTSVKACAQALFSAPGAVLILCVRPNDIAGVVADLGSEVTNNPLLVSVAAGVRISRIRRALPADKQEGIRIARVMPNLPSTIRKGASGVFAPPEDVAPDELARLCAIFSTLGLAVAVEREELIDAVTGISGSGPGFVYALLVALEEGGVELGLTPEVARTLAAQTFIGASELLVSTGESPEALLHKVVVPNGTTEAGLKVLTEGRVKAALIGAAHAAASRAGEIADEADRR